MSDQELIAMWAAYQAIKPLDRSAQQRAVEWLRQRIADDGDTPHPPSNVVRFRPDELEREIPV